MDKVREYVINYMGENVEVLSIIELMQTIHIKF